LQEYVRQSAARHGVACAVNRTGSAMQIALGLTEMTTFADTAKADFARTQRFAGKLLSRGIQIIGRGLLYMTDAHGDDDIAETMSVFDEAFAQEAAEQG